jgi:hypothetical protein
MSYGKVISGGKQMSKGLSKGINSKLEGFAEENKRRAVVATAVATAYKVDTNSSQHTNNVRGGTFTKPKVHSQV